MIEFENYYDVLGINPGASPDEIKRAYLDKCFILHPDRMSTLPESARKTAEKELVRVNQAYDVLKDPYKRQAYLDRWFNRKARPKPVVKPSHILFGTLEPEQTKRTRFVIENSGGSYNRLWFSTPDSWLKVISWRSLSGEELPLEVEIEATAPDWGETRKESIQVRLDDEETSLEVMLEVRPGPSAEAKPESKQDTAQLVRKKTASTQSLPKIPGRRTITYITCGAAIILAAILIPLVNIPALANSLDDQGNEIAYFTRNGGNCSVNLINADGSGQKELQQDSETSQSHISWAAGGSYFFLYIPSPQDADGRIDVINVASSNKNKYTIKGMSPVWSANGRHLMFNSDREANRQVYILEPRGSGMTKITSEPRGVFGSSAAWSGNGQKISYLARSDRGVDSFQVSITGADKIRLTGYPLSDIGHFKWSPDGLRIAFTADGDLYIINADGKNRRRLTVNGLCGDYSWSPDSSKIAFCSNNPDNNASMIMYVAGPENYEPVKLLDSDQNTGPLFAWSPDSQKLLFVALAANSSDIFSTNADGSGISQLTANSGYNTFPSWSGNSLKIAYSSSKNRSSDDSQIFVMSDDGSGKTVPCPGYSPIWSPR
jgi:TolB protein